MSLVKLILTAHATR